jgi:hypothetical protein
MLRGFGRSTVYEYVPLHGSERRVNVGFVVKDVDNSLVRVEYTTLEWQTIALTFELCLEPTH